MSHDLLDISTWAMVNRFDTERRTRRDRRGDVRTRALDDLVSRAISAELLSMFEDDDDDFDFDE